MATWALFSVPQTRWSWLRISGFSGTMFVHIMALILLAIPVAMPGYRPAPPAPSIVWIEAPPEPIVYPAPDEPDFLPRPHVVSAPIAAPTVAPDVPVDSVISESAIPLSVQSIAPAVKPQTSAPATTDSASLAYESIVQPRYPVASIRNHEQGTVLLRVTVGRDGLPMHSEVARSSGFRLLDKEAREVVLRWRFQPVRINGVAVQAAGMVPIRFDLANR